MYFVISDVHGSHDEMMEALNNAGFDKTNPNHILISCGDAADRGEQSKEVIEFLMDLYNQHRAVLIRGNHEDLMNQAMIRGYFLSHDVHNGTTKTVCQLTGVPDSDGALFEMHHNDLWASYSDACINYFETPKYIFVHGWIPVKIHVLDDQEDVRAEYQITEDVYDPDWRNSYYWEDARWINGMKAWWRGIREPGKTIVCGHWNTSYGHSRYHHDGVEWLDKYETFYIDPDTGKQEPHVNNDIFYDDGIIALDGCTAVSHKVNVLVLEDKDV